MVRISAVIITQNEEANIGRCITSLQGVVDEIIVVDAMSIDNTPKIAGQMGARVFSRPWKGYAENKNFGNQQATGDYIFSVDADEEVSPELRESILKFGKNFQGVYRLNRLTNYCGRWIYHSGWFPDYKIRLFPRGRAHWEGELVHERLVAESGLPVQTLHGYLFHYSFTSLDDHLRRINHYSTLAAQEFIRKKGKTEVLRMLFQPWLKFFSSYILKRGFLDGFQGLFICTFSAFDIFLRYTKVWEMRHRQR